MNSQDGIETALKIKGTNFNTQNIYFLSPTVSYLIKKQLS